MTQKYDNSLYKELKDNFKIKAKKKFGQHFLYDLNITDKIVKLLGNDNNVIEIGPGMGALTFSVLNHGYKLHVIEYDKSFADLLYEFEKLFPNQLEISFFDADSSQLDDILNQYSDCNIVSNLPYNISTRILNRLLLHKNWNKAVLMFQKEVAQRIVARENSKQFSRLSIISQICCDVKNEFDVHKRSFNPPPKVMSAVISLHNLKRFDAWIKMKISILTQFAFSQRRKKIKHGLHGIFGDDVDQIIKENNIDPNKRAEEIKIEYYENLAKNENYDKYFLPYKE